jgi:hypothetical protein
MTDLVITGGSLSGQDEVVAKEVGDILYKIYPNFLWAITMQDHNIIIRLMNVDQNGWCFFINRNDIPVGSPEKFRKMIITAGGEMLERLNINRKAMEDGQDFGLFEGSEAKRMLTAAGIKKQNPNNIIITGI